MTYGSLTDCYESWRVAIAMLRARLLIVKALKWRAAR
jgi:hypothetical protein